jgi:hypothetical protein
VAADFSVSVDALNAVFDSLTCCTYIKADSVYQVIVIEAETAGTKRASFAARYTSGTVAAETYEHLVAGLAL